MSGLGSCVICTVGLQTEQVSALPCGHLFHFDCVIQWVQTKSNCPTCRRRCREANIVKQLFISEGDHSFLNQDDGDLSAQVDKLKMELNSLREKSKENELKLTAAERAKDVLLQKVKNTKAQADRLRESQLRIEQLQLLLEGEERLRAKIKEQAAALSTSQFYNLVTNGGTQEEELARFIKDGHPDPAQFLCLIRKQLADCKKKLAEEVKEHEKCRKRIAELKLLVQSLREEVQESGIEPSNEKLAVFVKNIRPSLGFALKEHSLSDSLLSSASRPTTTRSRLQIGVERKRPLVVESDSDGETSNFPTLSQRRKNRRSIISSDEEAEKENGVPIVPSSGGQGKGVPAVPLSCLARISSRSSRVSNGMGGTFSAKNPLDRLALLPNKKNHIPLAKNHRFSEIFKKKKEKSTPSLDESVICLD